jgi:hypothetical protein
MAFKSENLTPIANNTKLGVVPALWMYWNEAGDAVTGAGFIPKHYGVKAKDQVMVIANDGANHTFYHATVDGTGVITLVENA